MDFARPQKKMQDVYSLTYGLYVYQLKQERRFMKGLLKWRWEEEKMDWDEFYEGKEQ